MRNPYASTNSTCDWTLATFFAEKSYSFNGTCKFTQCMTLLHSSRASTATAPNAPWHVWDIVRNPALQALETKEHDLHFQLEQYGQLCEYTPTKDISVTAYYTNKHECIIQPWDHQEDHIVQSSPLLECPVLLQPHQCISAHPHLHCRTQQMCLSACSVSVCHGCLWLVCQCSSEAQNGIWPTCRMTWKPSLFCSSCASGKWREGENVCLLALQCNPRTQQRQRQWVCHAG